MQILQNLPQKQPQDLPKGFSKLLPFFDDLKLIPNLAWNSFQIDYIKHNEKYDPTLKAGIIHAHMVHEFKHLSLTTDGLEYYEPYSKQHLLIASSSVLIRFKKMDEKHQTSNIPTKIQNELRKAQLSFFENTNLEHFVEVGYIPVPTWDSFYKIVIQEIGCKDEPKWFVEYDRNLNFINSTHGTIDMFDPRVYSTSDNNDEIVLKIKDK